MRVRAIEDRQFTFMQARTLTIFRKPNPIHLSINIGRKNLNSFKHKRNTIPYSGYLDWRYVYNFMKGAW